MQNLSDLHKIIDYISKMKNLSVLREAIENNNLKAVRKFCQWWNYCDAYEDNEFDPYWGKMEFSLKAINNNNLDIFKIVFAWSNTIGIFSLFNRAIENNQLPFVKWIYPAIKDSLEDFDRLYALEDTKKPGFEALHAWLQTAFYPQIAFDNWQAEWGFDLKNLFESPNYEKDAKHNTDLAAGKIDEDGWPIEHHGNT